MTAQKTEKWTVARYLATRMEQLGLDRMFGVPGNHLGPFLSTMKECTNIEWVGTTNEINGGFAADGYARIKRLGAVGVTYGVGAFSLINTIGGAFVEQIPLIVINASPTNEQWMNFRSIGLLTSHMSQNPESNLNAYRQVSASAQMISNNSLAPSQIDTALEICITEQRPVYLEVRENVWTAECPAPEGRLEPQPRIPTKKNLDRTKDAVKLAVERIRQYGKPILWGGIEIQRFQLADKLQALTEATGIPYCTTIMGKSILPETHPNFIGVYNGKASLPIVREIFENKAHVRIGLGAWTTSKNLGGTRDIGENWIKADHEGVRVGSTYFPEIRLEDFIEGLHKALLEEFKTPVPPFNVEDYVEELIPEEVENESDTAAETLSGFLNVESQQDLWASFFGIPKVEKPLGYDSFILRVNSFLRDSYPGHKYQVLADAGFSLLSAQNLTMFEADTFHSQASWLSIGYSLPAATGLSEAARDKRTMVFIGDGAFQETCQALSSHTRLGHDAVVFVFNNGNFYGIEQMLVEPCYYKEGTGDKYKDHYNILHPWNFPKLAAVFGHPETPMHGHVIRTHEELEQLLEVLDQDWKAGRKSGPRLVQVVVPIKDYPKSIAYKVKGASTC